MYETGGMRRVHRRGRDNILKRLLLHGAAFNLSLILRKTLGAGKPRYFQGLKARFFFYLAMFATIIQSYADLVPRSFTASPASRAPS
jgi:hypothetical protein